MANVTYGGALLALTGQLGYRNGNAFFRGMSEVRKTVEAGQRYGEKTSVVDARKAVAAVETVRNAREDKNADDSILRQREEELTAELEAVREARSKKSSAQK